MFYLEKTIEISAAHWLTLDYQSKCNTPHGHNWKITIYCKSNTLDEHSMIVDFGTINQTIKERFDHTTLNNIMKMPTAENIAKEIAMLIPKCYKVRVQESEGNIVIYEMEKKKDVSDK